MGALLVAGATSGAGKSTVTSALCRALARRGVDVAPFKAQNMSNHSAVTADGGEIGRAQAMQALAARVAPDRRMGPVLLKPSGMRSHVVVLGEEVAIDDAVGYGDRARRLRPVVLEALTGLRRQHEVVVLEGAGGAAEPNLWERDIVNLPLAAAAGLPAVLVVDIDRGGAFAAAYGTWALLPDHLRACLQGFVLNGMRGDVSLLDPALPDLEARTGLPVLGVLPHLGDEPMLGVEDSLDLRAPWRDAGAAYGAEQDPEATAYLIDERPVRVAVVRLPHLSNPSDLDPLVLEPSVQLRWATRPDDLADADLVVLPGTRATVSDLAWLRRRGLADALTRLADRPDGPAVLGICGGYQMLCTVIEDEVESGAGVVPGLGLLPAEVTFGTPKVVRPVTGRVAGGPDRSGGTATLAGYQIHLGRVQPRVGDDSRPWLELEVGPSSRVAEGSIREDDRIRGTTVHGILDADGLRHELLDEVAGRRGRRFVAAGRPYAVALDAHLDRLADWVEEHLDLAQVQALSAQAVPPGEGPGW